MSTTRRSNVAPMNYRCTITEGAIFAPYNALTRGYRGWQRRDYADGTTAIRYYKTDDTETTRVLVWDRAAGTRQGYLWHRGSVTAALRAFRTGERTHSQLLHQSA